MHFCRNEQSVQKNRNTLTCTPDQKKGEVNNHELRSGAVKLLTVPEAADILRIKPKTLRDWIWKRKIETVRNGSRYVRIDEAVVQDFINSHTVPMTSEEIVRESSVSRTATQGLSEI